MIRDYIKIVNFGNNYLIHITPELDIVVNKSYIYKNLYILSSDDIFFGKVSNIFYSFFQLNRVIYNRYSKNFIFNILINKH
jgi:hypothetical protein